MGFALSLYIPKNNKLDKYINKSNYQLNKLINNDVLDREFFKCLVYLRRNGLIKHFINKLCKKQNIQWKLQWCFECCTDSGGVYIINWIYNYSIRLNKKVNIHNNNDFIYKLACCNRRIDVLNWLLYVMNKENSMIYFRDIEILNRSLIIWICMSNDYKILKWVCNKYTLTENDIKEISINACKYNRCELIKLISNKYEESFKKVMDKCFHIVCNYNYIWLAKMLCKMNNNYYIEIKDRHITEHYIYDEFSRFINDESYMISMINLLKLKLISS